MSREALEALLVEVEPEIRAADKDTREDEILEQKGVIAAGKLAGKSYRTFKNSPVRSHCLQTTRRCSLV